MVRFKRVVSLLLALCLMMVMLPAEALAASTGNSEFEPLAEDKISTIISDGKITETAQTASVENNFDHLVASAVAENIHFDGQLESNLVLAGPSNYGRSTISTNLPSLADDSARSFDFDELVKHGTVITCESGTELEDNEIALFAATEKFRYTDNGITWSWLSDDTLNITGTGTVSMLSADGTNNFFASKVHTVNIGEGITAIDDRAFANCADIVTVNFPSTLQLIGFGSFAFCSELVNLRFKEGLLRIGQGAFGYCTSLQSVSIPSTCALVDVSAFQYDSALSSVEVSGVIADSAFRDCPNIQSITFGNNVTEIGGLSFYATKVTRLEIPDTVTAIKYGAFADSINLTYARIHGDLLGYTFNGCTSLAEAIIAPDCTKIESSDFVLCEALKHITIPAACKYLGEQSFAACTNLETIALSDGLESLGVSCFYECESLRQIDIPETVTTLGEGCFNLSGLTQVVLPASVATIGKYCFQQCKELLTVVIAEGAALTEIADYSFGYCPKLWSVTLPSGIETIGEAAFAYDPALTNINLSSTSLKGIGNGAFGLCTGLTSIHIPDSCTSIGTQAFFACEGLQTVDLSEKLTVLGDAAFYHCAELRFVNLPDNLAALGPYTFNGCANLTTITIPDSVSSVGEYAFYGCEKLETVKLPAALAAIEPGTFGVCRALTSINLPTSISSVGDYAFYDCTALPSIDLPSGLTSLGKGIFIHCTLLKYVSIPAGITKIPEELFANCEKLTDVPKAGGITEVGDYAFVNCAELKSLGLSDSVTRIGDYAFANCSVLDFSALPASLTEIGECAFANCEELSICPVGADLSRVGDYAFSGCTNLELFSLSEQNSTFSVQNDVLYSADGGTLIAYPAGKSNTAFVVPSSVYTLSPGAFYGNQMLCELFIPDSVTRIPERTFFGCTALKEIHLPAGLLEVDAFAFSGCTSLRTIELPNTVKKLGSAVFNGDVSLSSLDLPDHLTVVSDYLFSNCPALQTISLPDGVTEIGQYAFFASGLTALTLPVSVTKLGEGAFSQCDKLHSMTIPAGVEYVDAALFANCTQLAQVSFHGAVFAIGNYAFSGAASLKRVHFAGNAPETVGEGAFFNTDTDLTFFCPGEGSDWTIPSWKGPDGVLYRTATTYSDSCGETLSWSLDTHTGALTVRGEGEMRGWNEPGKAPWSAHASLIRSVTIENGVTSVGACAFMDCENLVAVTLADSVEKLDYAAFAGCTALKTVEAPNGLRGLGICLFYGCRSIEHVELHSALKEIPAYAFFQCRSLSEIHIPSKVEHICEGAFADCLSLSQVFLEGTVNSIDSGAFLNCSNLAALHMEDGFPASAAAYAFSGTPEDAVVFSNQATAQWTDGDGVSRKNISNSSGSCGGSVSWQVDPVAGILSISGEGNVQDYAANDAPWYPYRSYIKTIEVAENIRAIGSYAFSGLDLAVSVSLPQSLTGIGDYAFADCSSLASVDLPDGLTFLGEGAFCGCASLEEVSIPAALTSIEPYAFMLCVSLRFVKLPDGLLSIGYGAFYLCPKLSVPALPSQLRSIDDWAFARCIGIREITLPHALDSLGAYAFYACESLSSINIPDKLTNIPAYAFSQTALASITLPGSVTVVYESAFEFCEHLRTVTLSESTTALGDSVFYGCSELSKINLCQVQEIGTMAFMASGLESVTLPSSIRSVGPYAFADCSSLTEIRSDAAAFSIRDGVLYQNDVLLQYPAGKAGEKFTVPASVSEIAEGAFYGARNLTQIVIGNQVTSLGKAAFALAPALETAQLGTGISSLPEALFGDCSNFREARFQGSAPSLSQDVFYGTAPSLTLYWNQEASGWTEGTWQGSDGENYHTISFSKSHITMELKQQTWTDPELSLVVRTGEDEPGDAKLLLAIYQKGKMSAVYLGKNALIPNRVYTFDFRVDGALNSDCEIKAFLLDESSFTPLTPAVSSACGFTQAGGSPSITLRHTEVRLSAPASDYKIALTAARSDNAPQQGSTPTIPDGDLGGYSVTTITIPYQDINQFQQDLMSGSVQDPEVSKTLEPTIDMDISLYNMEKTLFDKALLEQPISLVNKNGETNAEGRTEFAHVEAKVTVGISGGKFENGNFVMPKAQAKGIAKYEVLNNSMERKAWNVGNLKIKSNMSFSLLGVEASGTGSLDIARETELGMKLEANVAEAVTGLSICGPDGEELISIGVGVGVGAGAKVSAAVGKDSMRFKLGVKAGVGGLVDVGIHPGALAKAFIKSYPVNHMVNNFLLLKTITATGNIELLKCYYYETSEKDGSILSFREIPFALSLLEMEVWKAALPKSNGGAKMPDNPNPVPEPQQGGVAQGSTSEGDKNTITATITLTERQKVEILAALLRQQMFGIPSTIAMQQIMNIMNVSDLSALKTNLNISIGFPSNSSSGIMIITPGGPQLPENVPLTAPLF